MAYENMIFRAAIRESDCPNRAFGVADLAEIRVMGSLAQGNAGGSWNRESYVKTGLEYLDGLPENVALVIEDLEQCEGDLELIEAVRQYVEFAKQVDRDAFIALLERDWDERYADDEAE